jgi:hypothetical protein
MMGEAVYKNNTAQFQCAQPIDIAEQFLHKAKTR